MKYLAKIHNNFLKLSKFSIYLDSLALILTIMIFVMIYSLKADTTMWKLDVVDYIYKDIVDGNPVNNVADRTAKYGCKDLYVISVRTEACKAINEYVPSVEVK